MTIRCVSPRGHLLLIQFFFSESFLLSIVYTVIICFMDNIHSAMSFIQFEFDTKVWSLVWADELSSLHVYFY